MWPKSKKNYIFNRTTRHTRTLVKDGNRLRKGNRQRVPPQDCVIHLSIKWNRNRNKTFPVLLPLCPTSFHRFFNILTFCTWRRRKSGRRIRVGIKEDRARTRIGTGRVGGNRLFVLMMAAASGKMIRTRKNFCLFLIGFGCHPVLLIFSHHFPRLLSGLKKFLRHRVFL